MLTQSEQTKWNSGGDELASISCIEASILELAVARKLEKKSWSYNLSSTKRARGEFSDGEKKTVVMWRP